MLEGWKQTIMEHCESGHIILDLVFVFLFDKNIKKIVWFSIKNV